MVDELLAGGAAVASEIVEHTGRDAGFGDHLVQRVAE
jgi:hypothetical protein